MNIEIIDKWLTEEYGVSYTDLEELHNRKVDEIIELHEKYTQALEVAQDRFNRIQKAIDDLEKIKKFNPIDEKNCVNIDIDHIDYLLNILKGGNNE